METPFYLKCLGQPALIAPDGDVVRFRTRKHLALLVHLGVERRSHRRDHLADLLWSSVPEGEARHSLATALSIIRSKLGPDALDCSRDEVRLSPAAVTTDLARLQSGDIFGDHGGEMLDVAGFLEGFEVADAVEFMLWKDRQQARWLPMIRDALVRLMDRCRRTGDFTRIERVADRMLVLDELSEEAIRAKMEARAFAGDRLTALRIFEAWKDDLARELGAAPSPLVEGMAIRLRRRGWERTATNEIPSVPTDHWKDRPFIGRGPEYRVLYEGWERMQRGEIGHALVAGDSGIGKSTLVERFTTAAALEGAALTRVQCYEPDRGIPYGAVGLLVPPLLERPGASATPPEALAELARTVPEVRRRYPAIPQAPDSQGETARLRLAEAFHELLRAVGEEHPVIVVVDDLHHCDDVSLAVLHLVIRKARGEPILIVFTVRPGELVQSPQAQHLLERAAALGIHRIDVPPLTDGEADQAITAMVGAERAQPSSAVRRSLVRAAAGYPMVLELLVQDWVASGDQCLAVAVDAMTAEPGGGEGGAQPLMAYRPMLDRLVRSLGATARNVANLASILGHRMNDLTMYGLVDLTIGQTMSGFAELVERRVLRDGGQRLEFVNELVRAHVYVAVPSPLRRALHGQIADRLIAQEGRGEKIRGLETAWHCIRAHRGEEATPYLLRGAREALYQGAVHEAELGLSTGLPALSGAPREEAVLLLAEVLQEEGRWSDSLDLLGRNTGVSNGDYHEVLTTTAMYFIRRDDEALIRRTSSILRRLLTESQHSRSRVMAARSLVTALGDLSDLTAFRELADLIAPLSALPLEDALVEQLALIRAQVLYVTRARDESLVSLRQYADSLRNRRIANTTAAKFHMGIGAVLCGRGDYGHAEDEFQTGYAISDRLGHDTYSGQAAAQIALCCLRQGRYSEVELHCETARRLFGSQFAGYNSLQVGYYSGFAAAMQNECDRAITIINRTGTAIPPTAPRWMHTVWQLFRADVLYVSRKQTHAKELASAVVAEAPREPQDLSFAGLFARWWVVSGQPDREAGLLSLVGRLDELDLLDQVEVLSACAKAGMGTAYAEGARERLRCLPAAVGVQLHYLDLI